MKVVAQLSDLRFGCEQASACPVLKAELEQVQPAWVVVCGDLTQSARVRQFEAAKSFLKQLPGARLVVPGDRDQPVFSLLQRFLKPLHRFRRTVCADLRPWVADEEMAALGINTTRPLNLRAGRISFDQLGHVRTRLSPLGAGRLKILVTHHPLLTPEQTNRLTVDWTASSHQALAMIDRCQLDLLLAGHAPATSTGSAHLYRVAEGHAVVAVQAGTPLRPSRRRHQPAYNLLELSPERILIRQRFRDGDRFVDGKQTQFTRRKEGWKSG